MNTGVSRNRQTHGRTNRHFAVALTLAVAGWSASTQSAQPDSDRKPDGKPAASKPVPAWSPTLKAGQWGSLFDGKTLKGWEKTNFGGEGDVYVEKSLLMLAYGADLTGVHTKRPLPKIDYEVELDAKRVEGNDFFCGLTFPVEKAPCSLILGGWGGGVCGLSSIDGYDASENETTTYMEFERDRWYHIRLRVRKDRIDAWIDDKHIVEQKIKGRKISIRFEVEPSLPFGFATYQTTAALRNIRIRKIAAAPPSRDAKE